MIQRHDVTSAYSQKTETRERVICVFVRGANKSLQEFAEACFRFSPQVSVREGEAVFLEIGGSLHLFREETILARLSVLAQRFGIMPQLGVASDAPTALAMARFGFNKRELLPLASLLDYAMPFERDLEAEAKLKRMVETLQMLGLRSLEDFVRLPAKTITSRFGELGLEVSRRVYESFLGHLDLVWPRFHPAEMISERIDLFDGGMLSPCAELEPLLFVIRGLADRVMARLRGRSLRLATLEIEASLEKRSRAQATQVSWTIRLPMPQGSVSGLLPILRDRLGGDFSRSPLVAPVSSLCLRVIETAPGHAAQRGLFSGDEDDAELWDALVGRLCGKLGKDRAFTAAPNDRHLPERAWKRSLEPVDSSGAYPHVDNSVDTAERPARVLKKPKPLEKIGDTLVHDEKCWQIVEWQGPERISCEWWRDPAFEGFNRDYYRVLTHTGEQLWVFLVPGRPGFYLHGYFD